MEFLAPNQLEEKYGGTGSNKEPGTYWPPSLNDLDFGVGKTTDLSNVLFDEKNIQNFSCNNWNTSSYRTN